MGREGFLFSVCTIWELLEAPTVAQSCLLRSGVVAMPRVSAQGSKYQVKRAKCKP